MMDHQQQTSGRTATGVKPYRLQHESVLSGKPSRGRLYFFLHPLSAYILVQSCDINCEQARLRAHRTLRPDLQSPFLSAPLCAGETQAQGIVMIEYRLQSAHEMLALQISWDLQHDRLAETMQSPT